MYEENATPSTVSRMKRAKWKDLDTGPNTWLTLTEFMAPARVNQPWCLFPFPSDSSFCPIITIHLILYPSHLPQSPVSNTNIVPFRFVLQYMLHTEMRILRKADPLGPLPCFQPSRDFSALGIESRIGHEGDSSLLPSPAHALAKSSLRRMFP